MGSSNNKARDEDRINDCVEFYADVVVVDLVDVGCAALTHKRKRACGEFP
jgi:hypothetical protein